MSTAIDEIKGINKEQEVSSIVGEFLADENSKIDFYDMLGRFEAGTYEFVDGFVAFQRKHRVSPTFYLRVTSFLKTNGIDKKKRTILQSGQKPKAGARVAKTGSDPATSLRKKYRADEVVCYALVKAEYTLPDLVQKLIDDNTPVTLEKIVKNLKIFQKLDTCIVKQDGDKYSMVFTRKWYEEYQPNNIPADAPSK